MANSEEWKTAFQTCYSLFESLVIPFELTNTLASFQHFINNILHPFLDMFCTAYIDDILIYLNTWEEHEIHVKQVLIALSKASLYLKPEKCEFYYMKVKYLSLIITTNSIKIDPDKVATIHE